MFNKTCWLVDKELDPEEVKPDDEDPRDYPDPEDADELLP